MFSVLLFCVAAAFPLQSTAAYAPHFGRANSTARNDATSLTFLFQNNLNLTDDPNHVGAILLDPQNGASSACQAFGESLLSQATIQAHQSDFVHSLSYVAYAGRAAAGQAYMIRDGVVSVKNGELSFRPSSYNNSNLPILCTQSSNQNLPSNAVATTANEITVASTGNEYVGFRNQKSFRFLGIPYANRAARFTYPSLYSPKGQTIQATAYGSQCAQASSGSEDCLFLNIQTPYIPKVGSKKDLRPVMFWIHGGGFVGGTGADSGSDGGQLASREDIVVVTINYRLSTLGFLAVPGTNITGNYGIADQETALQWTIDNIANFGGDPERITINGESAGAGSVRALLGSPPVIGKYQGAIAMSNLGGGVDLGLSGTYSTTYSSYLTIADSYARSSSLFAEAGCNQTTPADQVACIQKVDALTLVSLPTNARYVVQDGHYVNTPELVLTGPNPNTAHVPVLFTIAANDGADFISYPPSTIPNELAGIQASLGISQPYAQSIVDSGLFPYHDTGNLTLDAFNVSQRVATDNGFRCLDQATMYSGATTGAFSRSYYAEFERTTPGYDPLHLGGAPVSPGCPSGNPNLPYFRLHGSDMPWVFGDLYPLRDANDLFSTQLVSAYFAAFVRSGQPNPSEEHLAVRGYGKTLEAVREYGRWESVRGEEGPIRLLDYPSVESGFLEAEQCAFLNYSIHYYT